MHIRVKKYLSIFFLIIISQTVQANSIVTRWLEFSLPLLNYSAMEPTIATRINTLLNASIYDTWASYDANAIGIYTGVVFKNTGGEPTLNNKEEAISHAAYTVLQALTPAHKRLINNYLTDSLGYKIHSNSKPAILGRKIANIILDVNINDGANQLNNYADYSGYQLGSAVNSWQPEIFLGDFQIPITPHWGKVMPFALSSSNMIMPPVPMDVRSPEFQKEIENVLKISRELTDKQKAIAEYWVPWGNSPLPHLIRLTQYVSNKNKLTLDEDIRLFTALSFSLLDTSISVWESKYKYDYIRPITVINRMGEKPITVWTPPKVKTPFASATPATTNNSNESNIIPAGVHTIAANQWKPYIPTPPFPAYISGHSAFTAAWARTMKLIMGNSTFEFETQVNRLYVEDRRLEVPIKLSYPTYWAAAESSGISRIYGGIHWTDDNTYGLEMGKKVADISVSRVIEFIEGKASPISSSFSNLIYTNQGRWLYNSDVTQNKKKVVWESNLSDPLPLGKYQWSITLENAIPSDKNKLTFLLKDENNKKIAKQIIKPHIADNGTMTFTMLFENTIYQPMSFSIYINKELGSNFKESQLKDISLYRVWSIKKGLKRYKTVIEAGKKSW